MLLAELGHPEKVTAVSKKALIYSNWWEDMLDGRVLEVLGILGQEKTSCDLAAWTPTADATMIRVPLSD